MGASLPTQNRGVVGSDGSSGRQSELPGENGLSGSNSFSGASTSHGNGHRVSITPRDSHELYTESIGHTRAPMHGTGRGGTEGSVLRRRLTQHKECEETSTKGEERNHTQNHSAGQAFNSSGLHASSQCLLQQTDKPRVSEQGGISIIYSAEGNHIDCMGESVGAAGQHTAYYGDDSVAQRSTEKVTSHKVSLENDTATSSRTTRLTRSGFGSTYRRGEYSASHDGHGASKDCDHEFAGPLKGSQDYSRSDRGEKKHMGVNLQIYLVKM